jgi:hypothetical protein
MSGAYPGDWRQMFRPDIPNAARIYDYMLGGRPPDGIPEVIDGARVWNEAIKPTYIRSRAAIGKLVAGISRPGVQSR